MVSARDPAAAFHLSPLCRAAFADSRFESTLVAQDPAASILSSSGLPVERLSTYCVRETSGRLVDQLLATADTLLQRVRPDVVLCGLSSISEGGIDEALLARCAAPSVVLQDFWGDLNCFFGAKPDLAFVLDEAAAFQTSARHGVPSLVTGSLRHSAYRSLDTLAARRWLRRTDHKMVGLFGQPLHAFDGYRRTLEAWADAVHRLGEPVALIYRPHPRETAEQRSWTRDWLQRSGLRPETVDHGTTEEALAACDVACSIMSNCTYDAAYLNFFSAQPLIAPMLLIFNDELRAFYDEIVDVKQLPYVAENLAVTVWREGDLVPQLDHAINGSGKLACWKAARKCLHDPSHAIVLALDALYSLARTRSSPSDG